MNREQLGKLYKKYDLSQDHIFKQTKKAKSGEEKTFYMVTRSGIEKIEKIEEINVTFETQALVHDFACFKAIGRDKHNRVIETFGSAKYGGWKEGNTTVWHVPEVAENRARARAVLKLTGLYDEGLKGEDEEWED
jgi:hypothetical protein